MWDRIKRIDSSDENVFKYVFESEKCVAESVLYRDGSFLKKTAIDCSTQSGCLVGCRFCGSGDFFVRSLTAEEIVSQPKYLLDEMKIDIPMIEKLQIMFMSMGEPLFNFKQLTIAMEELYDRYPHAQLLISTIGPRVEYEPVRSVSERIPTIGLQFSVHDTTDHMRDKLIPFHNKLTLGEIANEGVRWFNVTGRRPFFNYCARPDNTSEADADRLLYLFPPDIWEATISVVCERRENAPVAHAYQQELASNFESLLLSRDFSTRIFNPAGQDDIGGGCGQLWFFQEWARNNPDKIRHSIGAGRPEVHAVA